MNSAFGGLLFLHSPAGEGNSITVNVHHVVLTPTYDLTDPNRALVWKYKRTHAAGLWADLAGRYIVFNLPSKSVLHLDHAQLDRALSFWDSIVLAHHELRGTKPTNRERIVCDEQPSAGYMRTCVGQRESRSLSTSLSDSGYPIVTHMDVSDSDSNGFLFNCEQLETIGNWGLFHELGHNMQQGWWSELCFVVSIVLHLLLCAAFDGTGEVTVNIFTLHAMDKVCHHQPWMHSWLKDQVPSTKEYIENGSNFDDWKEKAGVALFIYAQLIREYGWESYKAVFREYEQKKPHLHSDQEKMDHWIATFSRHVGHNLIPLFKFWGFPVSESTVNDLQALPIPQIFDEFIQIAPDRYSI